MSGVSLQIPVLFDVSAGAVVFGQDTSGIDIFDAHLKFDVAAGNDATNALLNEFKNIMYADAPEVFTDGSGVLFFSASSDASTDLGKRINEAILGETSKLKQSGSAPGNSIGVPGDNFTSYYRPPGIPLPNYDISRNSKYNTGTSTSQGGYSASKQGYYTGKITESGGTSFGRVLIRLMATHLMGHPFAQDFIANEKKILDDISNCDVSPQVSDKLLKHDASFFTSIGTTSRSNTDTITSGLNEGEATAKSGGICNTILLNLYESLLGSAPERFDLSGNISSDGTDVSGSNSDPANCIPRKLPFETNDTIAFYFRPTVQIRISDNSGISLTVTNDDLSGVGQATASAFSGTTLTNMFFNPRHRWIGHDGAGQVKHTSTTDESKANADDDTFGDGRDLLMTGTDLHHAMSLLDSPHTVLFDGHVWKCILTL